ncbi:pyridoxamine 5'-phosphate oxidase family protein [Actinomadura sp. B10D3]|uniref:pyridoxamine 5'-phosphate oxidase family protein n=1 Tax=Actinomadura sp. B10D3 TaxID=3153557 RepID=UPI00325D0F87
MQQESQLNVPDRVTTVEEVEAIVGRPASAIMLKQISALDEGCRTILAQCPIAAFGYRDAAGTGRTTFIGGTPGFARVHSPTRISFTLPEPGEPHGPVSFFFLLPGVGEILRVNGSVAGRRAAETTVDIEEAYVHCAQAVLRSRLWQPPAPADPAAGITGDGPLCRPGVADFLAAAPFLALSSWDSSGGSDTSPRGDRQAVARILDGRTLVIPDRRGNKRADTLHNLLEDDRLSLAALVPGRTGVLHVRGRGAITTDPALLETMALRGMSPHAALLIDVEHAELTGNDAVARSRLWTPGAHLDRDAMPDLIGLAREHLTANSASTDGGPPAFPLRVVGAIPGINRLLRLVINRAYRSGLRKEGYEDIEDGAGDRRRGSTHAHRDLRAGDRLAVRGPSGSFHIEPQFPEEIVLVAAHRDRLSVTHVLTSRDGRLDAAGVGRWINDLQPSRNAHYYICGPEPLMETVRDVLAGLAVPDTQVHHERYTSGADATWPPSRWSRRPDTSRKPRSART